MTRFGRFIPSLSFVGGAAFVFLVTLFAPWGYVDWTGFGGEVSRQWLLVMVAWRLLFGLPTDDPLVIAAAVAVSIQLAVCVVGGWLFRKLDRWAASAFPDNRAVT